MTYNNTSELEAAVRDFIKSVSGSDESEIIRETPRRFTQQLLEAVSGYDDDPKQYIKLFPNKHKGDYVAVRGISFSSICEHHLLPFFGTVDIVYLPRGHILGLSKFARITDVFSKRLQLQERFTANLADFLQKNIRAEALLVQVNARHLCMSGRGVKRTESITHTVAVRPEACNDGSKIKLFLGALENENA